MPRNVLGVIALVIALLTFALLSALAWRGYDQLAQMEIQLARRIGEFDAASNQARVAAKAANDALIDLNSRLQALEGRALETQNQQLALTAMYQELARSQDERIVAEIEQTLLLAQQHLQLAGNVRAALIGLESAEARLGQLGKPQFSALRAAIVKDMERLKLTSVADIEGMYARIEALIQSVPRLKLEYDIDPPRPPDRSVEFGTVDRLARWSRDAWSEFKELVRIRRLDNPDMPLLTPTQTFFLRENLKLRLLSAKLSLLQRDEVAFRVELEAAQAWVKRFFNQRDDVAKAFLASVEDMLAAPIVLKDARLVESLGAARRARGGH